MVPKPTAAVMVKNPIGKILLRRPRMLREDGILEIVKHLGGGSNWTIIAFEKETEAWI